MSSITTIGIIGHGKFGILLESILKKVSPSMPVKIFSRKAAVDSERFYTLEETVSCDLIIPVVPIHSFEEVIKSISTKIHDDAVVMDMCSVKEYPAAIMKKYLSENITIIAGHPLFGPGTLEKQNGDFTGLKIVMFFISGNRSRFSEVQSLFADQEFKIIGMNPEDHDKQMAKSQFIAHVTAGVLNTAGFGKTMVDTKSAEVLHDFMTMIQPDIELLKDMYRYNPYCKPQLKTFEEANKQIINLLSK